MIAAAILTAGASSRMGVPKANLKIGTATFLNAILTKINRSGFTPVYIVTGYHHLEISRSVDSKAEYIMLQNHQPGQGQLSSLQLVIRNLADPVSGLLVALVDHPLVQESTYRDFHSTATAHPQMIILPRYQGHSGHPVYFGRPFFNALRETPLHAGAREVVRQNPQSILYLDVPDAGVIRDIDTPEDLMKYSGEFSG